MQGRGRTSLTDGEYEDARRVTVSFLKNEERVTNTILRRLAGVNYDQAIRFFGRAIADGTLVRMGRASGTYYVLNKVDGR